MPSGHITPAGYTCYDDGEVKALANFKKGCDVCKMNLVDTTKTLNKCIDAGLPATRWWADPKIVISGIAVTFTFGVLVGALIDK